MMASSKNKGGKQYEVDSYVADFIAYKYIESTDILKLTLHCENVAVSSTIDGGSLRVLLRRMKINLKNKVIN